MTITTFDTIELETLVKNEINKVILQISNDFNINKKLIDDNILHDWKLDLSVISDSNLIKEKKKRPIDPINFCLARKPNLERCTRNKKIGSNFCASHQFNHPFGRIDDNLSLDNIINKTKTKSKHKLKGKKQKSKSKGKGKGKNKGDINGNNHNDYSLEKNIEIETVEKKINKPKKIRLKPIIIGDIEYYIDQYQHVYLKNYINNQIKYKYMGIFDNENNKINLK
jgi:hypothetical protein